MTAQLRYSGRARDLTSAQRAGLMDRRLPVGDEIAVDTRSITERVRTRGDEALFEFARAYDQVELESLEVPRARITGALDAIAPGLRRAMERARDNIATVHRAFAPSCVEVESERGVIVGRRPDPLGRVGVYAPGGRAAYASSVLMGVVPARVARVPEVILCSPPAASGEPSAAVLAAAAIAGVDRVFAVGGAGAIAAMAFGTQTIPRVDRVVGPGNEYVASAKLQVVNDVGIDCPAGPSELLVITDGSADPEDVAMEMVAQAEHDPRACAVALAIGEECASALVSALELAIPAAARREIVAQAFTAQGGVLTVADYSEALSFSNEYAAEHLWLAVADADELLESVRNTGTVFLGNTASVAFGDYMTGANHVLPTGGLARWYSGLSPLDFVRWTTYQRVTRDAAARLATDVALFADAESLPGHAAAARRRGVFA